MDNVSQSKNSEPKEVYLPSTEAGKELGYTPDHVARLCRLGELSCLRVGNRWQVEAQSLHTYLARSREQAEELQKKLSVARRAEYEEKSQFVSSQEAARLSGYSQDHIARLCRDEELSCTQEGTKWRVRRDSLRQYQEQLQKTNEERNQKLSEERKRTYKELTRRGARILDALPRSVVAGVGVALLFVFVATTQSDGPLKRIAEKTSQESQLALLWPLQFVIDPISNFIVEEFFFYTPPPLLGGSKTTPAVTTAPSTVVNNVTNNKITNNTFNVSGVSETQLNSQLNELEKKIIALIPKNIPYSGPSRSTPVRTETFAQAQRIDQLSGVAISGGTISGAAISGGSLSGVALPAGSVTGVLALANGGTGTSTVPLQDQLLIGNGTEYDLKTLTAGSNITISTTSNSIVISGTGGGSSFGQAFELVDGALAPTTTVGVIISASSTIADLSVTNGTTTNATTTTLAITSIASSLLKTAANGVVSAAIAGTDYLTSAFREWTLSTNTFGQSALAPTTTQNIAVSGVGTSTFAGGLEAWRQVGAPYFNATSTTATSTFAGGLTISGGLSLFNTYGNSWDDFCTSITGGSGLCDGTDNTGGGSGLATSTDIVDTYVIYGTSASDVGAEAAFTYDDATDRLTVVNASTTNISASYASSTQAFFGSLNVGSLTGLLRATAGVVATATIDLVNDVGSSILAVANGGTGWANLQANTLLLGNGTSRVATTSAGTNGQILSLVSGVPSWVSTTTFSGGLTYSAGNVTADLGTSISAAEIANGDHGDFTYTGGSATIDADAVALGTDTTGNYVATLADSGAGTLTISGSGSENAAVTASLNLGNANTWTALQQFARASSTQLSAYTAYFGGTATSTFSSTGALTLASALGVSSGGTGSTSPAGFLYGPNDGTLQGTTTISANFIDSAIARVANLVTTLDGLSDVVITSPGFGALLSYQGGSWIDVATSTLGINFSGLVGTASDAQVDNNLTISGGTIENTPIGAVTPSTGVFTNATSTNATTTTIAVSGTATTSALVVSNSFRLQNLTGLLRATAGVVATATIDLVNDVGSSILAVANGGTGWANLQANTLLLGNGTGRVATTSAGTNGQILSLVSGVPSWVATTTFSGGLTYSAGNVTADLGTSIDISSETNLAVSATGLELSGDTIALSTGYSIPLTASTTNWNSFYDTPSTRITAGTGLSWAGNTLNATGGSSFGQAFELTSNTFSQSALAPTTTQNLLINGIGTSTFAGGLEAWRQISAPYFHATSTATSTLTRLTGSLISGFGLSECADAADKLIWNNGLFSCGADAGAGGGITALGAQYSSFQTGSSQTFATSSDTNLGLTITSSGDTHTFTPTWTGTLTATRGGTGLATIASSSLLIGGAGNTWLQFATSSLGIAFSSLVGTASDAQVDNNLTISGGTIENTPIGAVTPSTGVFTNATSTNATTTNIAVSGTATTSALVVSNSFRLQNLTGLLRATAGVVATATIDLVNDVGSSVLAVANGGTGWANLQANTLLLGNGTSRVATTSAGTNGQVLSLVSGVPSWVATTTFSSGLTYSGGNVTNTGVLSLAHTFGSAQTGAITLATSSSATSNGVTVGQTITNSSGVFTFTPTVSVSGIPNSALQNSTISGIALGNTLAALSATNGTLTFSGSYDGSTARTVGLNLGNANTWTALQQFNAHASTTQLSVSGPAYFANAQNLNWRNSGNTADTAVLTLSGDTTILRGGGGTPTLQFQNTSGTALATFLEGGNVGIGTTTPWAKLAVNPVAGDVNQFVVGSSTATSFLINSAGQVGIGTTSPGIKLDVLGNGFTGDGLIVRGNASNEVPTFYVQANNGIVPRTWALQVRGNEDGQFRITDSTAGSPRLSIDTSGNVGIGTTTPKTEFYVKGTSDVPSLTNQSEGIAMFESNSTVGLSLGGYIASPYGFWLQTKDSQGFGGTYPLLLNPLGGNVGIGSTSPYAKLSVSATAGQTAPLLQIASSSIATTFLTVAADGFGTTTLSGLNIAGSATSTSNVGFNITTGCFAINGTCVGSGTGSPGGSSGQFQYNSGGSFAGASALTYDSVNNLVGIGSTSPWAKLAVNPVAGDTNQFVVGSSTRTSFIINSAGNVGVGTTSPQRTLHVLGSDGSVATFPTLGAKDFFVLENNGNSNIALVGSATAGSGVKFYKDGGSGEAGQVGYNYLSDYLFFNTNGPNERVRIDSSGNVGIGSTTPWAKLAVNPVAGDTNQFVVGSSTATSFLINSAGNVGVGTTNPAGALDVRGNGAYYFGNVSNPRLRLSNTGGTASTLLAGADSGTVWLGAETNAPLYFVTNNTERVRIDASGNVGIGTTLPAFAAGGLAGGIHIATSSTGATSGIRLDTGTADYELVSIGSNTNFGLYDHTAGAYRIYVEGTTGEVGIGQTAPASLLHVGGTASADRNFQVDSNGRTIIRFDDNSSNTVLTLENRGITAAAHGTGIDFKLQTSGSTGVDAARIRALAENATHSGTTADGALVFSTALDGTLGERFRITSAGNVGIGTTSPGVKLEIAGTNSSGIRLLGSAFNEIADLYVESSGNLVLNTTAGGDTAGFIDLRPEDDSFGLVLRESDGTGTTPYANLYVTDNGTSDYLNIRVSAGTSASAGFYVTQNDTVGIGTSTPAGTLGVAGSIYTTGAIVVGNGTGKITVGTIDPVYTIDNVNYATYVAGMVGQKEEVVGSVSVDRVVTDAEGNTGYTHVIDLDEQEAGSDLWIFARATEVNKNIDKLTALLTPSGNAKVWYQLNKPENQIIFYSNTPVDVSYRLTAPRFDYETWTNFNHDGITGFMPEWSDETYFTDPAPAPHFGSNFSLDGIWEDLKSRVVAWFADIGNGIGDVFARAFNASERICIDGECLTADDVRTLKNLALAGVASPTELPQQNSSNSTTDTEAPRLTVFGNNPAVVAVGNTYVDLGAQVSDTVDQNLGIHTFVDGVEVTSVVLDTSTSTTYAITYRATDNDGNVSEAERLVIVGDLVETNGDTVVINNVTETSTTTITVNDGSSSSDIVSSTSTTPVAVETISEEESFVASQGDVENLEPAE